MPVSHFPEPRRLRMTARNAWFQKATAVKANRKKRWQHRLFFVEDVRSINQLLANERWHVEALLYAEERALSGWAKHVLETLPCEFHLACASELVAELSDKSSEPSELQALVRIPEIDHDASALIDAETILLLDRPSNPGNLGSIIRSCDAFGVGGLVIVGHAVDPFEPITVRASAGAFFHVPLRRLESRGEIEAWFERLRAEDPSRRFIGTSARAETTLFECDLRSKCVLMMGNETLGLSDWLKSRCDQLVSLPMRGKASSLNVACAATAVLCEVERQRTSKK
jgi:tRNA G18 (ribose-2'-O)-methylase SpoU